MGVTSIGSSAFPGLTRVVGRTVIDRSEDDLPIFGPATCDRCNVSIPYVWKDTPNQVPWWSNALDVRLHGRYGEYVDFVIGAVYLVLCEKCADALMVFLNITKDDLYSKETQHPGY